ncbi:MAG: hypothetical protein OXF93_17775 [Acidobacteria bacterium]|nr:hypothetical protein [Acidobacteriota bacterium]
MANARGAARVLRDQPQVAQVEEVFLRPRLLVRAGQDRLDHPPHPFLAQLVGQLVDVRVAAQDQALLGGQDVVAGDGAGAVPARLVVEAGVVAQRVDQPRLAGGARPDHPQRVVGERLSRIRGVLGEQSLRLRLREVAEPQRLRLDVESAAPEDERVRGARPDAVVAHVHHPAQDDAVREAGRPLVVAGPQLPEHGHEGVADQRVDLVDQEHQWPRVGAGPARQHVDQRAVGAFGLQCRSAQRVRRVVAQRHPRPASHLAENGAHRPRRVLARGLADLEIRVHAAVVAAAVQEVAERQQGRRLAGLARRVQHEVLLVADETQHGVEIDALERRDAVVVFRPDGTLGVEEAHPAHCRNPRRVCHAPAYGPPLRVPQRPTLGRAGE